MIEPRMANTALKFLLRVWRMVPVWAQFLAARVVRPRYRVGVVAVGPRPLAAPGVTKGVTSGIRS